MAASPEINLGEAVEAGLGGSFFVWQMGKHAMAFGGGKAMSVGRC